LRDFLLYVEDVRLDRLSCHIFKISGLMDLAVEDVMLE
jgi:hypothetical protein